MSSLVPKFVTLTMVSTLLLTACGGSSERSLPAPPVPPAPPASPHQAPSGKPGDVLLGEVQTIRFYITDARKLTSLVADKSDNPRFYAVRGKVLPKKKALAEFEKGAMVCYSRIINTKLRNGQVIAATSISGGESPHAKNLFFANVSRVDNKKKSAVSVVCMKMGSPVLLGEASHTLRGIVKFVR